MESAEEHLRNLTEVAVQAMTARTERNRILIIVV